MTHRPIAAVLILTLSGTAGAEDRPARLRLRTGPPTARGLAPEATRPAATWADNPAGVRPLTAAEAQAMAVPTPTAAPLLDLSHLRASLFGPPDASFQPESAPAVAGPASVYARGPAYRWYGWGAVPGRAATPAKPSDAWMSQTGATPGAFPAAAEGDAAPASPPTPMAVTPMVAPPVATQVAAFVPTTSASMTDSPLGVAPLRSPTGAFDANQPVSMTNVPPLPPGAVLVDPNFAPGAPPMVGVPMTPLTPMAVPTGVPVVEPVTGPPQAWRAVPSDVVQASATASRPDPAPPLERAVREAVRGLATAAVVTFPAPGRMTVALTCRTAADGSAAAEAVWRLPAAKPLAVEFAVTIRE